MSTWIDSYEKALPSDMIVTAVVGYRIWYIPIERPGTLHSWTIVHHQWKPCERVEASCANHLTCASTRFKGYTRAHEDGCNAGVYAFKTKEQAQDLYIDQLEDMVQCCSIAREMNDPSILVPGDPRDRIAVGKVYLWGKVLECTKGFRGQYAYPAALYNTSPTSPQLAAIYRVPLISFREA